MTVRSLLALLLLAGALSLAAACGGEDEQPAEPETPTEAEATADELRREAEEVATLIRERVEGLTGVRSLDELEGELEETIGEVERKADEVGATEAPDDLEDERDQLSEGLDGLSTELEDVRAEVEDRDLSGALSELGELDALDDIRDAIDRIRAETGG